METGNLADELHEFFKRKLLPPVFKTIMGGGEVAVSTTDLDKAAFSDFHAAASETSRSASKISETAA